MSGKSSQRKGRVGELELCRILQGYGYPVQAAPPLSFGQYPDLIGLPDIHIECKRKERLDLSAAVRQAQRDAERFKDGLPAVFHRRNRELWLVTMTLEDWLMLYKAHGLKPCMPPD